MENLGTFSFLGHLKELVNQKRDNYLIEKLSLSLLEEVQTLFELNHLYRTATLKIKCSSSDGLTKKVVEKKLFKPQFSYPSASIKDLAFARSQVNTKIYSQHICNRFYVEVKTENGVIRSSSSPNEELKKEKGLINSLPDMSPEVANSFFDLLVWNQKQDSILCSREIENKGLNNITVFGSDIMKAELKYQIDNSIRYKFNYWMTTSLNYSTQEEEI
jgi:hypothetical protein